MPLIWPAPSSASSAGRQDVYRRAASPFWPYQMFSTSIRQKPFLRPSRSGAVPSFAPEALDYQRRESAKFA